MKILATCGRPQVIPSAAPVLVVLRPAWLCSTGSKHSKPCWLRQCPGHRLPNRTPPSRRRWCQVLGKHWPRPDMQLPVFKTSVLNQYVPAGPWCRYVSILLPATCYLHFTKVSANFEHQVWGLPVLFRNAFTPILFPEVPTEKVTRHLLFLICARSASIVACCIHEGHARAQCSKERNDQSQQSHHNPNGTDSPTTELFLKSKRVVPFRAAEVFQKTAIKSFRKPCEKLFFPPNQAVPPCRTASRHHSTKAVRQRWSPGFPLRYRQWNRPTAMQHMLSGTKRWRMRMHGWKSTK